MIERIAMDIIYYVIMIAKNLKKGFVQMRS